MRNYIFCKDLGTIAQAHDHNYNHEAVNVPEDENPFATEEEEQVFHTALAILHEAQTVPHGYYLQEDEWENGTYSEVEALYSGRRGSREIFITLPNSVWRPRAEMWARALDLLVRLTE